MAPRGFTNPAPKTESARSALSSFTCTLCNKSYSRHPEYEAHIGSYDHQHRKRLQDLKQLSRDPNAAERARKAERKADAEAGLIRVDDNIASSSTTTSLASKSATGASAAGTAGGGKGGGGFKKGGFKSSFTTVKGPGTSTTSTAAPVRKNVLGDDDDDDDDGDDHGDNKNQNGRGGNNGRDQNVDIHSDNKSANRVNTSTPSALKNTNRPDSNKPVVVDGGESDTDDEYSKNDPDQAYYDPSRPTGCFEDCAGRKIVSAV